MNAPYFTRVYKTFTKHIIIPASLTVIADLIRNPEGRQTDAGEQYKTTDRIPLSLDGRGIKGEGDSKAFPTLWIPAYAGMTTFS